MNEKQETQGPRPVTQAVNTAELKRIKNHLCNLRGLLRETKRLKPKSEQALDSLDIEVAKAFGEDKKRVRQKFATACGRYEQLLALQARLQIQIYKLKARKEELEHGTVLHS